ncbi:hypothetical protein ACH5RR_030893 [Cinchona calisaya]|uniref:SAM domain-containing protein n=1 Tax=Cinchona calisaya TaxID=153742 RepID=A0ABD2YZ61_9GENT
MAELHPPDISISAAPLPISPSATSSAAPPPPPPPPPPSQLPPPAEIPITTTATAPTISYPTNLGPGPSLAPKRQRRPSVRLGEIGDQSSLDHSHSHPRRPKTWRFHKDPSLAAKTSKTRPLTNLVNGAGDSYLHDDSNDDVANYAFDFVGGKKTNKTKKPTKRLRSNWASSSSASAAKFDSNNGGLTILESNSGVFRDDNQENNQFRDLEAEGSQSPIKEQTPVHSTDNQNMGLQFWDRRAGFRARLSHSESLDHDRHGNDLNFDNTMNRMNSGDDNRRSSGVRDWLIGLGLGRYAPVFEIHEVDDEVLPMLTLEDLKDMGINAVGSRRKMYSAILKLRKGFS